jgi:hypothetical protein
MWVHEGQRDSFNIDEGTGEMRQQDEKQREFYKTCRVTYLV